MDKNQQSKTYHRVKILIFFLSFLLHAAVFIVLALSGLSVSLRNLSLSLSVNPFLVVLIYMSVFGMTLYLADFPFRFFEGFTWEHRFNLSNQKLAQWLADDLKKAFISGLVILVLAEVVYTFLRNFPLYWWIGAGLFWLLLTLFLAKITPHVLVPLFYKYSPIINQDLRNSILRLFKEGGVAIQDAYTINFSTKTKKANAFICGLGKSRRVVLSDTLIEEFSIPEIEAVVAHEMGHYRYHDVLRLALAYFLTTFFGFYLIDRLMQFSLSFLKLNRVDDIALFPALALFFLLWNFLTMPLLNAYSRVREEKADAFSLKLTGKPDDFISTMEKLGAMNLAEFDPGIFVEYLFYDHPPIGKRIKFARKMKASSPLVLKTKNN